MLSGRAQGGRSRAARANVLRGEALGRPCPYCLARRNSKCISLVTGREVGYLHLDRYMKIGKKGKNDA